MCLCAVYYVWCVCWCVVYYVCAMLEMLRPCRAAVVVAVAASSLGTPAASTTSAQSPVASQQPRRRVAPAQPAPGNRPLPLLIGLAECQTWDTTFFIQTLDTDRINVMSLLMFAFGFRWTIEFYVSYSHMLVDTLSLLRDKYHITLDSLSTLYLVDTPTSP